MQSIREAMIVADAAVRTSSQPPIAFEVWPHEGCREDYLQLAANLRPLLAEIDGFISVERFQSITEPGKMLSLSIWRDEAAVEVAAGGTALRRSA